MSAPTRRRLVRVALVAAPGLVIVVGDVVRRAGAMVSPALLGWYALTAVASIAFWAGIVLLAGEGRGPVRWAAHGFGLLFALFGVGGQAFFFRQFRTYVDATELRFAVSNFGSFVEHTRSVMGSFLYDAAAPVAVVAVVPIGLRRTATAALGARVGLSIVALALGAFAVAGFVPEGGGPPDILLLAALGTAATSKRDPGVRLPSRPPVAFVLGARAPRSVPPIVAAPTRPRNVLFVLTESVRADAVCSNDAPGCAMTPYTREILPGRYWLHQLRALDSSTAVSLGVLATGLPVTEPRLVLDEAPVVWEYVLAARLGAVYWSGHNATFGGLGDWLRSVPFTDLKTGLDLDPSASQQIGASDDAVVSYALGEIPKLHEPFFATVHLAGTHFRYLIDANDAPWKPYSNDDTPWSPETASLIENRYRDAIRLQDRHIARLLRGLFASPAGARTVVVFTSDHGESFYEKGHPYHGLALFEEDIHVPAWIYAPAGTLSTEEASALRGLQDRPRTMLDLFPTFLDLMGVWKNPALANLLADVAGESLLRGGTPETTPVVLSNCTQLWTCPKPAWGALLGEKKLVTDYTDGRWHCFDVIADPSEHVDLGEAGCSDLVPTASRYANAQLEGAWPAALSGARAPAREAR